MKEAALKKTSQKTLVIDVGGSNVKVIADGRKKRLKIPSGPSMGPEEMVEKVKLHTSSWEYDRISLGVPTVVIHGKIVREPANLGTGWLGFNFAAAFGMPCKVINDAAMQALGCYQGGTLLFLGLGTGLGTTLICDGSIVPMEAGHLPYRKDKSFEYYVGKQSLKQRGFEKWERHVRRMVKILRDAFNAEDVVIGGGNAELLDPMPKGTRRTDNHAAFKGGFRLWEGG